MINKSQTLVSIFTDLMSVQLISISMSQLMISLKMMKNTMEKKMKTKMTMKKTERTLGLSTSQREALSPKSQNASNNDILNFTTGKIFIE